MSYISSLASRIERFDEHYMYSHKSGSLLFYTKMFDTYWDSHQYPPLLTKERLSGWICRLDEESVQRQVCRILLVRYLGRYLQSIGESDQYVLPYGICPKVPDYVPYFFAEDELRKLFSDEVMGSLHPVSQAMSRQYVLPQLFSTIHCCGLRPGEARKLLVGDVDLEHGWLDIKGTKTYRDRRLPIGEMLLLELKQYDLIMQKRLPERKYFFPTKANDSYKCSSLSIAFSHILRDAGIGQSSNGNNARLYDLRHHFVFRNINTWIEDGKDVYALLPYLRLYLGHSCIENTEYYLHWVPEFFPVFERLYGKLGDNLPEVSHG
ncbi:site-specific recombinase XerD [Sphaerochaeta pleomorpha str. Grapes]|uniref:Site-specific recombinase XerD n=1 Tax=Sphaerochaeta pleomorpha (strain ATCC BAA-1885 / DSM 22778 / Grapes) TaxID=158190 RepID=G8QS67_SPHPG|nr:tyrosine-type recombinase/integrase [Sphaerochaeta pleomorpha]AEV28928.1 site-specific recombinase XerD [Sphaerochaeta pleomorpha str. Grapes]AEV29457.1 site-specific recombinase XerD [Sphaerochaeta pleomorpha str. Grapes]